MWFIKNVRVNFISCRRRKWKERLATFSYQTRYRCQLKFSSLQFAQSATPNNKNRNVSRRNRDELDYPISKKNPEIAKNFNDSSE